MMVILKMASGLAKEPFTSQMEKNMLAIGKMMTGMEKEFSMHQMEKYPMMAFGKMTKNRIVLEKEYFYFD